MLYIKYVHKYFKNFERTKTINLLEREGVSSITAIRKPYWRVVAASDA